MKNFWQELKKKKEPILALAPMAGITDCAFRLLCREFGADVVYSEMTSADGLFFGGQKTLDLLEFNKKEQPLVVQLFGKKPELFGKVAKIVEESGAMGIDINFGCPAKKVVAHGGGVTLMRNLNLCYEIIQATVEAVKIPVSIKVRTSINLNCLNTPPEMGGSVQNEKKGSVKEKVTALDFVEKIKDLNVSALMIHGRSYEYGFAGKIENIDFEMIKNVKDKFNGVVLGNGGINSPEDAKLMLEQTGVDGLGLARALYGKPWLFKQIKEFLQTGKYSEPDFAEIKNTAIRHAELLFETKGEKGMYEIRKHLTWYIKGFDGAVELRKKLVLVNSVEEVRRILGDI
jgi:tRNA dihydrouridine synthase A